MLRSPFCEIANDKEGWISVNCLLLPDVDVIDATKKKLQIYFFSCRQNTLNLYILMLML